MLGYQTLDEQSSLPSPVSFTLTAYLLMFRVINGKSICSFNAQHPVFNCVRKGKLCPQSQLQEYVLIKMHSVWRPKADLKPDSDYWS